MADEWHPNIIRDLLPGRTAHHWGRIHRALTTTQLILFGTFVVFSAVFITIAATSGSPSLAGLVVLLSPIAAMFVVQVPRWLVHEFPEHKRTLAELEAGYTTSEEVESFLATLHIQAAQSSLSAADHLDMLASIRSRVFTVATNEDWEEAMAIAFVDGRTGRVIRLPHEPLLPPGEFKARLETARRAARTVGNHSST
ncbi:hypothetical protein [Promicromonospora sp. NPDC023987]|uniref:hypothetical protein n=1 Tax=Promicromonospora sp. NPDC023987 TaxID=3155360 RepID=UPI0034108E78